ncbi:MAG: lipopolysaccharide biosynthesis protein, partial [Vicinamibacteria bacterium]
MNEAGVPDEHRGSSNLESDNTHEPSASRDYFDIQHLKTDIRRRSVRGGAFTLTSQLGRAALHLASTAILARLLTPGDFGLVAMATALTAFLYLFREMGLSTATVQRAEVNHGQISTLFWINLGMGALMGVVLIALARPIAWFYQRPDLTNVVLVLALALPLGALAVQHRALLQRQMRFGVLGAIELTSVMTGTVAAIALALSGAGYWSLVAMPLATELVSSVGTWIACGWRPGLPRRGSGVRAMLGFGGNLAAFNLVNYLARNLDNILIGKFLGPGPLGQYSRAYGLLMMPLRQVNAPLGAVAVPALSRLADSPERYQRGYCDVLQKTQMLLLPGIAFLMVCADWVIFLVLGPQWRDAAAIFAFLGLAGITQPLTNTTGWLFITQGRSCEKLRCGFLGACISIA